MKSEHFEEFEPITRRFSLRITMTENEAREFFYGWPISEACKKMKNEVGKFLNYVNEQDARDE